MSIEQPNPIESAASKRSQSDRDSDEWIDETMAEGDIANGEGDPDALPQIRRSQERSGDVDGS